VLQPAAVRSVTATVVAATTLRGEPDRRGNRGTCGTSTAHRGLYEEHLWRDVHEQLLRRTRSRFPRVDLKGDPRNCGTCGHDCTTLSNVRPGATGVQCVAGACSVPPAACASGFGHCSTRADDGCETPLTTSSNCGQCGKTCTNPTGLCSATGTPTCSSSCTAPTPDLCTTKCVSLASDPTNCGACNHDCTTLANVKPGATGIACSSGVCYVPPSACASGHAHCSAKPDDGCEADLSTPATCGAVRRVQRRHATVLTAEHVPDLPADCGGSTPDICTKCVNKRPTRRTAAPADTTAARS
jgi:hypothetical protein